MGSREELQLVEEQDDSSATISSSFSDGDEEVGEIEGQVAVVTESLGGVDVKSGLPGALAVDLDRERLEHAGGAVKGLAPLCLR